MVKIENVVILKERERDNLGVMVKMGNSLNEVLPFLLQMVTFQDFQISIYSEMMASLGNFKTHGGNLGDRGNSGNAQFRGRRKIGTLNFGTGPKIGVFPLLFSIKIK